MKKADNYPRHIGLILDGNRRYARSIMLKPWQGHEMGADKIDKLLDWTRDLDIKELTLYCFSIENFQRSKDEVDQLMRIFLKKFNELSVDKRLQEFGIRINFVGDLEMLPQNIQEAMNILMERTKEYTNFVINFAMAYSGRRDIVEATKKIVAKIQSGDISVSDIDENMMMENLYVKNEPDMIIRTGGVQRSSNFLCYQAAYSEWFYLNKTWPEFMYDDLKDCVNQFVSRERRFGK